MLLKDFVQPCPHLSIPVRKQRRKEHRIRLPIGNHKSILAEKEEFWVFYLGFCNVRVPAPISLLVKKRETGLITRQSTRAGPSDGSGG